MHFKVVSHAVIPEGFKSSLDNPELFARHDADWGWQVRHLLHMPDTSHSLMVSLRILNMAQDQIIFL